MSGPTILQLVHIDETGDSYYRMRWPAKELPVQRNQWRVINLNAASHLRYEWAREADLLVLYQSVDLDLIPIIRERREKGKKTIVEYNDNFYASPAWGPVAKEWASPLIWQSYERMMKEADYVMVTGPGLEELFSSVVPREKIRIIKNHLPRGGLDFDSLHPATSAAPTIGWAGSLGHMADLLAFTPTIREVLEKVPTCTLHLMGNEAIPTVIQIPSTRFKYTNWGTMAQYFEFWKPVQIGIAPLLDTAYNRCRSDIKAVEMAGMGTLPLLPDALPYREFINATGITPFRNKNDLKEQLLHYLNHPVKRREDAKRCFEYVYRERIGTVREERAEFYESLLPDVASPFHWPLPEGYQEVNESNPNFSTPTRDLLLVVQEQARSGNLNAALESLKDSSKKFPANPEVALAQIKCMRASGNKEWNSQLRAARMEFPRDLRFPLWAISVEESKETQLAYWNDIVTEIKNLEPASRVVFHGEVLRAAAKHLHLSPRKEMLDVGRTLVSLYPHSGPLNLALAEALLSTGAEAEAQAIFTRLGELHDALSLNGKFAESVKRGYLSAWEISLAERTGR